MSGIDEVYDLLERFYAEFQENKKDVGAYFDRIDGRLDRVEGRLDKIEIILEQDIKPDIKCLHGGYKQTYEKLTSMEATMNHIADKVDHHDIRIQVIECGQKKRDT